MDALDKQLRINQLFSLYQSLLTKKQQTLLSYYYLDNYSLSEIAEFENISRNAVHDALKKGEKKLEEYEVKLQLLSKSLKREALISEMRKEITNEKLMAWLDALEKVE